MGVHRLFLKPYNARSLTTHTHEHSATTHSLVPWCVVQSLLDNHLKSNCSPVKKLHHRKIVHKNIGNVQLANTVLKLHSANILKWLFGCCTINITVCRQR